MIIYLFASIGMVFSAYLVVLLALKSYSKLQIKMAISRKFNAENKTIAEMHEAFSMLEEYTSIDTPPERRMELKKRFDEIL